jgi:hypothetical protein
MKKQAEAGEASSGKHDEATVIGRDSASDGAAVATDMPSQKKKRNTGTAVRSVSEVTAEQRPASGHGDAAGLPPDAKPPRKRKRRGEEQEAAADAGGDGAHNGGSAEDGGPPDDAAKAVLQRRAEKVAAMAERLQASREAMVERLKLAKVAAAEVSAACMPT